MFLLSVSQKRNILFSIEVYWLLKETATDLIAEMIPIYNEKKMTYMGGWGRLQSCEELLPVLPPVPLGDSEPAAMLLYWATARLNHNKKVQSVLEVSQPEQILSL